MFVSVYCRHYPFESIVLVFDKLPPKFNNSHLSIHYLNYKPAEYVKLQHYTFTLQSNRPWVLDSLRHQLSQLQVLFWKQETSELQSTYFSYFHIIEPTECIGQQLPMRSPNRSLKVFLA